jgi:hypothetical protein
VNYGPRVHIDHFIIETHLTLTFEKDIDLIDLRMAVPVTGLFAWFVGGCCHANDIAT